jgi:hypothetical protein
MTNIIKLMHICRRQTECLKCPFIKLVEKLKAPKYICRLKEDPDLWDENEIKKILDKEAVNDERI